MEINKFILNQSKTKSILFGSRQNLAKSPFFFVFGGKVLERVSKFSYLGVALDEALSWKDHVEYLSSKVSSRLALLTRTRSCLSLDSSKKVHTALVQPLFLESPGNFSGPLSHCKISNLASSELFYSHMKGGSLHTRSFERIHFSVFRYR